MAGGELDRLAPRLYRGLQLSDRARIAGIPGVRPSAGPSDRPRDRSRRRWGKAADAGPLVHDRSRPRLRGGPAGVVAGCGRCGARAPRPRPAPAWALALLRAV